MPGGSSEERREAGLPRAEPSSRPQKRALADAEVMAMASPDEGAAAGVVTMGGDTVLAASGDLAMIVSPLAMLRL